MRLKVRRTGFGAEFHWEYRQSCVDADIVACATPGSAFCRRCAAADETSTYLGFHLSAADVPEPSACTLVLHDLSASTTRPVRISTGVLRNAHSALLPEPSTYPQFCVTHFSGGSPGNPGVVTVHADTADTKVHIILLDRGTCFDAPGSLTELRFAQVLLWWPERCRCAALGGCSRRGERFPGCSPGSLTRDRTPWTRGFCRGWQRAVVAVFEWTPPDA
jgi:hypothetical protein